MKKKTAKASPLGRITKAVRDFLRGGGAPSRQNGPRRENSRGASSPRRPKSTASTKPVVPTKSQAAELPPFPGLSMGQVFVPATRDDFAAAAAEILAAGVAGFDTESRPVFRAGQKSDGPHVVQFALSTKAFIFQMHRPESRPVVMELLKSERVKKVGFGLQSDHTQIVAKFGVKPHNVLDLDQVFRRRGHRGQIGVRGAIAVLLGQRFSKSKTVTTSNWAEPKLRPNQLLYAANDAYAALKVYEALGRPE